MKKANAIIAILFALILYGSYSHGADLTLNTGGRVTIELISSEADYHDSLSLVSPNAAIVSNGCNIEATAFTGLKLLSEKTSQHGCRVELDADPATPGIQPFAAGTVLRFNLCAQEDTDFSDCEHVWSSNPSSNPDNNYEHVHTTALYPADYPNQIFRLNWEDLENGGDIDFNDLIAVVRVNVDTDEDGLWDDWEKYGIDANGDGNIEVDLPAAGANPRHKDIFLEIDYMDCNVSGGDCGPGDNHSHIPKNAAITEVVQAFANAPAALVNNPDGQPGVSLHINVDDALPHQNNLPGMCFTGAGTTFDNFKSNPAYFGPDNPRRYAYHYVIFGHQQVISNTWSGCGEVFGNDFSVTLGGWNYRCAGGVNANRACPAARGGLDCPGSTCNALGDTDGDGTDDQDIGTIRQQAATIMHELGHNLSLEHGGGDCTNWKPNYLSIMNYWFQFSGIRPIGQTTGPLNYSEVALNNLDESNNRLNETLGIGDGANDTLYVCPNGTTRVGAGNAAIDWNCDNDGGADTGVTVNINSDCIDTVVNNCGDCDPGEAGQFGVLTGYNDWTHLQYDFQKSDPNYEDGIHERLDVPDPNYSLYLISINSPPISDPNGPYTAECVGGKASVKLDGTGSSDPDNDPITYFWSAPGIVFDDPTSPTPKGEFPLGTTEVTLKVMDGHGEDVKKTEVKVIDTKPPAITVTLNRYVLWPPNHTLADIKATVTVTDACDPDPCFVLTSITSDEPDNGLGDGDMPFDIQEAQSGTPDVEFKLRSERSGIGDGRTYTITYTAFDSCDSDHHNTSTATAVVQVPHDQSGHANSSSGFNSAGTGFSKGAKTFNLVVLSTLEIDARKINARGSQVGNTLGIINLKNSKLSDLNQDGLLDLILVYSVEEAQKIMAISGDGNPLAFRYGIPEGNYYLVPDIFKLGAPILPAK